jgi:hypothetical protein
MPFIVQVTIVERMSNLTATMLITLANNVTQVPAISTCPPYMLVPRQENNTLLISLNTGGAQVFTVTQTSVYGVITTNATVLPDPTGNNTWNTNGSLQGLKYSVQVMRALSGTIFF